MVAKLSLAGKCVPNLAVEAGRLAYLSGLGPERDTAAASSPLTGFLE